MKILEYIELAEKINNHAAISIETEQEFGHRRTMAMKFRIDGAEDLENLKKHIVSLVEPNEFALIEIKVPIEKA